MYNTNTTKKIIINYLEIDFNNLLCKDEFPVNHLHFKHFNFKIYF